MGVNMDVNPYLVDLYVHVNRGTTCIQIDTDVLVRL